MQTDTLNARRALSRLKRGVPPGMGIAHIAVGMERLESSTRALLGGDAHPRWFAVSGEYGEGKSFFQALSSEIALNAGYAVLALDVNKDSGALHQPQRHFPLLLGSMQSPLSSLQCHQGFHEILRQWFNVTPRKEALTVLKRIQRVTPWSNAGLDPQTLLSRIAQLEFVDTYDTRGEDTFRPAYLTAILSFLTGQDLQTKGTYARFATGYRFQVVQEWCLAVGHKGVLLFVDELDNVVRQIHVNAHASCYRTLAWYCSCTQLARTRVIFAGTPEVIAMLDSGGRRKYLEVLRFRGTQRPEEMTTYERWKREADVLAKTGWEHCAVLTPSQRIKLFERIAEIHVRAWGVKVAPDEQAIATLARNPRFNTTRRWVRAVVQILDLLEQQQQRRQQTRKEAWEMTLGEWRELRQSLIERLQNTQDAAAKARLTEIGGLTTDYAHKYRVKQAMEQGLAVPHAVLAEYPDL